MTAVRDYANLAPVRYQRPVALAIRVLAIGLLITIAGHYLFGVDQRWLDRVMLPFWMIWGLDWVIWPNGRSGNPLATRVIGGSLFAICLLSLVTLVSHHLA